MIECWEPLLTTKTEQVVDEDDRREKKWDHSAEIALEVPDAKIKTSPCPNYSRVNIQIKMGINQSTTESIKMNQGKLHR